MDGTVAETISQLTSEYPGHSGVIDKICNLLLCCPPELLFLEDPVSSRISYTVVRKVLVSLKHATLPGGVSFQVATVNAAACFHPRLFYDSVLNSLAEESPAWSDGCLKWKTSPATGNVRGNESFDGFLAGLGAMWSERALYAPHTTFLILIGNAERLKDKLSSILQPMTNLRELSGVPITTLFVSSLPWIHLKPSIDSLQEPLTITLDSSAEGGIIAYLEGIYSQACVEDEERTSTEELKEKLAGLCQHRLIPLYSYFVRSLVSVCYNFIHDRAELATLAASHWPILAKPVIDGWQKKCETLEGSLRVNDECDVSTLHASTAFKLPDDQERMRLLALLNRSLSTSLQVVSTGHSSQFNAEYAALAPSVSNPAPIELPEMHCWIMAASFLASYNPPKTDMLKFYRGSNDSRKKKKGGGTRKSRSRKNDQLDPRLLGPSVFPVERLLAILGFLLEENDTNRTKPPDIETEHVASLSCISELAAMGLLEITSLKSKRAGLTLKCTVSYEELLLLTRDLDINFRERFSWC